MEREVYLGQIRDTETRWENTGISKFLQHMWSHVIHTHFSDTAFDLNFNFSYFPMINQ